MNPKKKPEQNMKVYIRKCLWGVGQVLRANLHDSRLHFQNVSLALFVRPAPPLSPQPCSIDPISKAHDVTQALQRQGDNDSSYVKLESFRIHS